MDSYQSTNFSKPERVVSPPRPVIEKAQKHEASDSKALKEIIDILRFSSNTTYTIR